MAKSYSFWYKSFNIYEFSNEILMWKRSGEYFILKILMLIVENNSKWVIMCIHAVAFKVVTFLFIDSVPD